MKLSFPNPSRSYDAVRHGISFWGYDAAIEVPFFLEESALVRLDPKARDGEAAILATFDAARDRIHEVADRIHGFHKRSFHVLVADDFR
ncbi:MAG: DUF1488 domain-containing protein [Bauldia sp.]|nr:MAG: DUF1488 domain-containing protein [Bauldia sp.]MBZ0229985.1 DUF1488 domain-containing protein [Bauldia sp.]